VLYQLSYIGSQISCQLSVKTHQRLLPASIFTIAMNQLPAMQPRLDSKKAEDSERHQANPLIGQRGIRQHSESSECRERNYQPIHRSLAKPLGILPAGFGHAHAHLFSVCLEQLQKAKSPKWLNSGAQGRIRTFVPR
jgi:hypothetical protein